MGFYFMTTKKRQKARSNHQKILHHQYSFLSLHHFFLCTVTIFLIMLQHAGVKGDIKVNDYGVRSIKTGDTALVFYANASHTGNEGDIPITARLHMEKCCLMLPPNNTVNCDIMKLISGLGMVFYPKDTHVLQMYFVNFDLYDREGSCVLRLLSKPATKGFSFSPGSATSQLNSWKEGSEFIIPFKTVLPKPSLLKKLYSGSSKGFRICNTDNYNALHECSNFDDCLIRYAGTRSLFSKQSKECDPTPECSDSETNFLSIVTRKCEKSHDIDHIRKSFNFDMIRVDPSKPADAIPFSDQPHHLSTMIVKRNLSSIQKPNLVCENGIHVTDNNGRPNCTCHPGWRSLTLQEWQQKGGIIDSADEGMPYHHMCTVPLLDHKTRGYIIVAFFLACLSVPFIVMLVYNHRKDKPDVEKRRSSSLRKFLSEESSTSSSDDDHKRDEEKRKHKSKKNNHKDHKPVNEMGEEEAEKVIAEITNRREPQLSKKPSKRDDDDDDNPPPPSFSKLSEVASEASQQSQNEGASNKPSKSNTSIPKSYSGQSSQQSMPRPNSPSLSTTQSKSTINQPSPSPTAPPSSKPSAGSVSTERRNMGYYSPSGGFDYASLANDSDTDDSDEENYNKLNKVIGVATQTTSMDDLLSLKKQEKWSAHVPIQPKTRGGRGISVVVADCATVELNDNTNNVTLHSMSSEEITQRKKDEWAQFIQSVSNESFNLKPSRCSASLEGNQNRSNKIIIDEVDDDDEMDEYIRNKGPSQLVDFSYFHKDHKPKAAKVQSVPGMMQYHPFSCTSPPPRQELPQPPTRFIQKAFGEMAPEELASRQECYRTLSSLSNERLSSQEGGLKNANSIWSNIASENTKEPSTTPATTADGSRVVSSCEGVGGNSTENTNISIRTNTIYGDTGSDFDSDGALELMASGSSSATSRPYQSGKQKKFDAEMNRTVYGVPPIKNPTMEQQANNQNREQGNNNTNVINRLVLPSDSIPSDVYITDSGENSRRTSQSGSSTDFWKTVAIFSLGASKSSGGGTDVGDTVTVADGGEVPSISPETTSAYRIKSSLETALKASRSRSGTNLF